MRFSELAEKAINEVKIGGDPAKGLVLAVLALGVAVRETGDGDAIEKVAKSVQRVADAIEWDGPKRGSR